MRKNLVSINKQQNDRIQKFRNQLLTRQNYFLKKSRKAIFSKSQQKLGKRKNPRFGNYMKNARL